MSTVGKRIGRGCQGFIAGSLIGTLGGLIGLGGAEFRLPVLGVVLLISAVKTFQHTH